MSYTHLSLAERYYIEIERKAGTSINQMAKALGRSQSTLSREIRRNTGQRGYRHKQAKRLAEQRHKQKPKAVRSSSRMTSNSSSLAMLSRIGVLNRSLAGWKKRG